MPAYGSTVEGLQAGKPVYHVIAPKKLPLGGSQAGSKDPGLFRVYVPSQDGIELTLETTGGTINVTAPDGTPAKDAAGKPLDPAAKVVFETPQGVFGWYGVAVTGSTSYTVKASAKIKGNAKDANGQMLVPWNFYYFPFVDVVSDGSNHPSAKYDARFGGNAANGWEATSNWRSEIDSKGAVGPEYKGHAITQAFVDEYNKYNPNAHVDFNNCWWWGHCDAASCASTIFTKPQPNGNLQPYDIKWMLTEISMKSYDIELRFFLGGIPANRGSQSNKDVPDGSGQAVDKDIGPLHDMLVQVVKKEGHVALMDFRAPYTAGEDHSADVWNQACYKFEATLAETPNQNGVDDTTAARKIDFYNVLSANADSADGCRDNSDPEANPGSGWLRQLTYTLSYDTGGRVDQQNAQNRFKKCEWKEAGQTLYAPRYIFKIKGLLPAGSGPGNPNVSLDNMRSIGVTQRQMYGG